MRWQISRQVPFNSFEYFERTLITENGFREYDVRWLLGKEVNANGFVVLGKSYGTFIRRILKQNKTVVGHDFRKYSQDLCNAFTLGVLSSGVDVTDIGLAISPMLYFAQHHFQSLSGAMITASHNENGWTGIKLANGLSSTLGPEGIQTFRAIVDGGDFEKGAGTYNAFNDLYGFYSRDALREGPLARQLKVVIATGNGTAGRFAPPILRALGCDVVELDCEPDWNFPRYNPNPEDTAFLQTISQATKSNGAALGIGIDGDGDRIGVVDDKGDEVYSDKLGLLLARWLCPQYPNSSVVIDVKSTGLFYDDPVLRQSNTKVVTWKTGHSYIKAKVAEISALAGFEKSGHWFLNKPIGRGYDDAVLSMIELLRMLSAVNVPLSTLIAALPKTWQSPTMAPHCPDDVKYSVVEEICKRYAQDMERGTLIGGKPIQELITVNGIRFRLKDDSWGLIRASSNKPSLAWLLKLDRREISFMTFLTILMPD